MVGVEDFFLNLISSPASGSVFTMVWIIFGLSAWMLLIMGTTLVEKRWKKSLLILLGSVIYVTVPYLVTRVDTLPNNPTPTYTLSDAVFAMAGSR